MSTIVYTAAYGSEADPLIHPNVLSSQASYFCFTDGWYSGETWGPNRRTAVLDGRLEARRRKILSHQYVWCEEHDIIIWIDASFHLLVQPERIVDDFLKTGCDVAALIHPDRTRIKDEAAAVIRCNQAPAEHVRRQIDAYNKAGFDTDQNPQQRLTATGLLVRKRTAAVKTFESHWWSHVDNYTVRDQLSIDFCAWQCGIEIGYLEGHYRANPYARYIPERVWRKA